MPTTLIAFGRRGHRYAALALAILLVGTGTLAGCSSSSHTRVRVETQACSSRVLFGTLPVWARAGFSNPKPRMPHVLSGSGKITAILWANPLLSPPPRDHSNKILWVARAADSSGSDLLISAQRMNGASKIGSPVVRRLIGGPGPSIINMPAAGCWRFTLRWAGRRDVIDLRYVANR